MAVPVELPAPQDNMVHLKFYVSDFLLSLRGTLASNNANAFLLCTVCKCY